MQFLEREFKKIINKLKNYFFINKKSNIIAKNLTSEKMEKKKMIISYNNLSATAMEAFKLKYSLGYYDFITRITKPNGDSIHVVPLETEDAIYMVKIDVKIDTKVTEEELEKELFSSNLYGVDKNPDGDGDEEGGDNTPVEPDSLIDGGHDDD